ISLRRSVFDLYVAGGKHMSARINNSAFFLAVKISLIYAVCWVLFSFFFDKPVLFSMDHQAQHAALDFMAGFLYLSATTFLIFMLMKNQEQRIALLQSKLEIADESLESRVKLRTAELEESSRSLKRLKGIIPICANCKDIRNGSGEWEKMEDYIQERSDAEFSHGLCPDCDKELYGDRRAHFKKIASKYA
ncbi:MAG: hypothetical protein PF482_12080, partial [Desulfobacteraceae bacterium]|nr:hypothetical protein [Desulfobacteraceae bacterium]